MIGERWCNVFNYHLVVFVVRDGVPDYLSLQTLVPDFIQKVKRPGHVWQKASS